ncbi:MAG: RNA polymerase sigma factor [Sulfuricaulis sp.]
MNPFHTIRCFAELARTLGERRKKLYRVACAWCRDPSIADDLVQETLTKALKNIGQLRESRAIDSWLFQIMSNCWIDYFRRDRVAEDIGAIEEDGEFFFEDDHDAREIVMRVRGAVSRLPVGQREVLALVDLQGFSYTEVSRLLKIPPGTVTSRVCRARETLRHYLSDLARRDRDDQVPVLRRIK